MADFQYQGEVPIDQPLLEHEQKLPTEINDSVSDLPEYGMNIPPPFFSKLDMPSPYYFQPSPYFKPIRELLPSGEEVVRLRECTKQTTRSTSYRLQAGDAEIPTEPPVLAAITRSTQKELLVALKKLFAERPVWLRETLKLNVKPELTKDLQKMLPHVAYYFMNGPWGKTWLRYGYDPRTTPDARHYQVIDFRVPAKRTRGLVSTYGSNPTPLKRRGRNVQYNVAELAADELKQSPTDASQDDLMRKVRTFQVPPNRTQTRYQYYDVECAKVQKLLEDHEEKCRIKSSGWFTRSRAKEIRDAMKERLDQMLEGLPETARDSDDDGDYNGDDGDDENDDEDENDKIEEVDHMDIDNLLGPSENSLPDAVETMFPNILEALNLKNVASDSVSAFALLDEDDDDDDDS